jgi:signal transduction histidine kinase
VPSVDDSCARSPVLAALSEAVLAVTSQRSVEAILQTVVDVSRRLMDARYAALGVPDDEGSFARFVTSGVTDAQWRAIGPVPRQHGLLGAMLRRSRPYRVDDIRAMPDFWGWPAAHPTLVSVLGVPILEPGGLQQSDNQPDGQPDGVVLGAIWLANKGGGGPFTAADEHLITLLAAHVGSALANARLYERSRELTVVEERTRMARELHDAVAQKLFSLRLTADAAATLVDRAPGRAVAEVRRVRDLAGEVLAELRSVIFALRPAELEDAGLVATLGKHVEILDRVHDAALRWTADSVPPLPAEAEDVVFRVAQEALRNALQHSGAGRVEVSLRVARSDGLDLVLEVADDGRGFDVPAALRGSRRLGLASMRERAASVGGQATITSAPGAGATVRLALPLAGGHG